MNEIFYPGAVGMVETRGFCAALTAADAMLSAAPVRAAGLEKSGAGLVTVVVRGSARDVKLAVERGAAAAESLGKLAASAVIEKPKGELSGLLPNELG